ERARRAGRDHRHRAPSAARDDSDALERVEREVGRLAVDPDALARAEAVRGVAGTDHDVPIDRKLLERFEHSGARGLLGALRVGAAEPTGARQRGPLRHARVALAQAGPAGRLLLLGNRFDSFGHQTRCNRSAALNTSSRTADVAPSRSLFQITGTS